MFFFFLNCMNVSFFSFPIFSTTSFDWMAVWLTFTSSDWPSTLSFFIVIHMFLSVNRPKFPLFICHVGISSEFLILFLSLDIPFFRNFKFVKVCSLVGRYFCNMFTEKNNETVFSFNIKDTNTFPCLHDIRLSYNITKCACLHITVNIEVFFVKSGWALLQMYVVVPITKRGQLCTCILPFICNHFLYSRWVVSTW